MENRIAGLIVIFIATLALAGCNVSVSTHAILQTNDSKQSQTVISDGSPEEFRSQMENADYYVQNGTLYEFDTLKLASEGKLLTCFGNNAGSTYLILNMPPAPEQDSAKGVPEKGWDGEMPCKYDDPEVENFPANPYFSPAGMSFKMRQDEAVVLIFPTPDECKYWSYIAYDMFTEQVEGKDYTNEKGFFPIGDDESGHYHTIFGSIGSPVNMQNAKHDGDSAFGSKSVIVLCANTNVCDSVLDCLAQSGYPESMVNVMEIPTGVYRMGLERGKDTFSLFGRISQPVDREAYDKYMAGLSENASVFRVTPKQEVAASPFEVKPLQARGSGEHESVKLGNSTERLETIRRSIIDKYSDEYDYEELSTDIAFADGMTSYLNDANAQGDVHDAAYLISGNFELKSDDDFVVVYGANHVNTGKAHYFNAVLHERPLINGVCSIYDSLLKGSAKDYLKDAADEADGYYVYKMARNQMDDQTAIIPYSTGNEQGKYYGVDNNSPVFVLFRIYLDQTGVGADYYELINDRVIVFHKK